MADHFGAIAAGEIGCKRVPLVFPSPMAKNGVLLPLTETTHKTPFDVYKKPSTREEIDFEIKKLKTKYEPFMQRLAPIPAKTRESFLLDQFQKRAATKEDLYDFSRVLGGEGEWKTVRVPDFEGPIGAACHYYRTVFTLEKPATDKAAYLHFDGVDYIAEVYLNGSLLGTHEGFFGAFEFDMTPHLRDGENVLLVVVRNDFIYGGDQAPSIGTCKVEGDKLYAATGFGWDGAMDGWHHCPAGTGICQKVTVEIRPRVFLSDIFVRPMIESGEYEVFAEIYNSDYRPLTDVKLSYSVYGRNFERTVLENYEFTPITFNHADEGNRISLADLEDEEKMKEAMKLTIHKGANLIRMRFPMENIRLWSPDTPFLYEAQVSLSVNGEMVDAAASSFGMRSFTEDMEGKDGGKKGMFYLNGKSIRLRGANTMGFEQQDVLRGDMDMLLYDMLMAKACNMNFLRLTQRPVQHEIYDLCDTIGLMIQTDLPLFTVMRRTKFAEGIRQAEEMERLIRSHPSCILSTYINEPMANADNRPHRHFVRYELEQFFEACTIATRLLNPDRVIKNIDGDYDPPDNTLPDNHIYCTWYNGHGIDAGKLHRGYWLGVKDGWYYGCGEFGAEGLDPVPLMRRRYPTDWLPQTAEEEKAWEPSRIKDSQSGNMHYFYYDTQETLEDWVRESHKHQVFGTKLQTEAFRRNPDMITFAIHLFIDAWPSGWMKTIVDCERNPKPAFFAYRDALTPLMVNIRGDRKTYFAGEDANIEIFICNDTHRTADGHKLRLELIDQNGVLCKCGEFDAVFGANSVFMQGDAAFTLPETDDRATYTLRAILLDGTDKVLHYADEELEVFAREEIEAPASLFVSAEEFLADKDALLTKAEEGATLVIEGLRPGTYDIGGTEVTVKACGMRALHFVSRKTGHPLVEGFTPYDFRLWYDEKADCITPLIRTTFRAEGMTPILTSGNSLRGSAWGQKLYPALACAEKTYGKGKIVVNQVDLNSHLANPVCRKFRNRLGAF